MGRYAFFNTDFEYKFWFSIQESTDIQRFGGIILNEYYHENEFHHKWEAEIDLPFIKRELSRLETIYGIDPVDCSTYKKSISGTYAFYDFLQGHVGRAISEQCQAHYILGYLIYHQLTYTPELTVSYEM